MSGRWWWPMGIGAIAALTLIAQGWGLDSLRRAPPRHHLEATRIIGTAERRAGRAGEPAVWRIEALVGGDRADLYRPEQTGPGRPLPVALLLQGANVEKRHYASFAAALAREGFLVVVPNHWRRFPPLPLLGRRILLADQRQIGTTLAALKVLNGTAPSPLRGTIDGERLVVVGHSMGGLAGLEALAGRCRFPLCLGSFVRPRALRGGVFYGTDLRGHGGGPVAPIDTDDLPVALIRGSRDGLSSLADVQTTWERIRTPHKALLTVEGANHYAITDSSRPLNPPQLPAIHADPNAATIDPTATITAIAHWSGLFLRAEALGEPQAEAAWRRRGVPPPRPRRAW